MNVNLPNRAWTRTRNHRKGLGSSEFRLDERKTGQKCAVSQCINHYFSSFTDSFTLVIKGQESHFSVKPLQTQTKETKDKNKALEKEKRILYISKVSGFSCVVVQRNVHVGNAAILGEEAFKIF